MFALGDGGGREHRTFFALGGGGGGRADGACEDLAFFGVCFFLFFFLGAAAAFAPFFRFGGTTRSLCVSAVFLLRVADFSVVDVEDVNFVDVLEVRLRRGG